MSRVDGVKKTSQQPASAAKYLSCLLQLLLSELQPLLLQKGAQQQLFTWPPKLSEQSLHMLQGAAREQAPREKGPFLYL